MLAVVDPWKKIPRHVRERAVLLARRFGAKASELSKKPNTKSSFLTSAALVAAAMPRLDDPRLVAFASAEPEAHVEIVLHSYSLRVIAGAGQNHRPTPQEAPLVKVAASALRRCCAESAKLRSAIAAGERPRLAPGEAHLGWAVLAARLFLAGFQRDPDERKLDVTSGLIVAVAALCLLARQSGDSALQKGLSVIEGMIEKQTKVILGRRSAPHDQAGALTEFLARPLAVLFERASHAR